MSRGLSDTGISEHEVSDPTATASHLTSLRLGIATLKVDPVGKTDVIALGVLGLQLGVALAQLTADLKLQQLSIPLVVDQQ
jgi:hypothetical protein